MNILDKINNHMTDSVVKWLEMNANIKVVSFLFWQQHGQMLT